MDNKMSEKEYKDFMWNENNAYACKRCPENRNDVWSKLPCGQQNCWVVCHARHNQTNE